MKTRTTKKEVRERFDIVIKVGYCDIQALLRAAHAEPFAYTCGAYGWNADIYAITYADKMIAICTGYRSFGDIKASSDICKMYEDKAVKLINSDKCGIIPGYTLLIDFINEVLRWR